METKGQKRSEHALLLSCPLNPSPSRLFTRDGFRFPTPVSAQAWAKKASVPLLVLGMPEKLRRVFRLGSARKPCAVIGASIHRKNCGIRGRSLQTLTGRVGNTMRPHASVPRRLAPNVRGIVTLERMMPRLGRASPDCQIRETAHQIALVDVSGFPTQNLAQSSIMSSRFSNRSPRR